MIKNKKNFAKKLHGIKKRCIFVSTKANNMTTQVNHPTFGTGIVIAQDDKTITVDFNGNVKVLVSAFSRLTNMDGSKFGQQFVAKESKPKKRNKANFMSKDEYAKSKYSTMSKEDWEEERRRDAFNSKSF